MTTASTTPPRPQSIGHTAARGAAWYLAATIATKIVNFAGVIVVGWLLGKKEYGQVGMALAVAAFGNLIAESGLLPVLVNRQARFPRWATAGFWLSLTLGFTAAVIMAIAGPLTQWVLNSPGLAALVWVMAGAAIASAMGTVPSAALQIQLRFRLLAVLSFGLAAVTTLLMVFFAWRGFGAFSFVLPILIALSGRAVIVWALAKPRITSSPQTWRWPSLLKDGWTMMAASLCWTIMGQGDYVVLGAFHSDLVVGVYFFAFNLSTQTHQLLVYNLGGILFPVLSRMQDDLQRQTEAFLSATRAMAYLGMPLCALQIALADPVLRLLYGSKWVEAIPLLQVLTIAMAIAMVGTPATSMLQAQGRFRAMVSLGVYSVAVFLTAVTIGAWLAAARGTAWAVVVAALLIWPVWLHMAVNPAGIRWRRLTRIWLLPTVLACVAVGIPAIVFRLTLPWLPLPNLLQTLLIPAIALPAYGVMVRSFAPQVWADLVGRFTGLLRGRTRVDVAEPRE